MKKLAYYASLVLITISALYLIYVFRTVIILFLLSLFTASALRPVVVRLTRSGMPATAAIFITYAAGLILAALTLFVLARFGVPELIDLSSRSLNWYQSVHQAWSSSTNFQQSLATLLPAPQALLDSLAAEEGTLLAQALLTTVSSFASLLAAMAIILVLSIYWTVDRLRFEGLWLSLLPASRRGRVRKLWEEVQDRVGDYIRSQSIQVLLAILLLAAGYFIMGIRYPLLLAILSAITWLIPVAGILFAVAAALIVGLVNSPILGLLAAVFTIVTLVALRLFVQDRLLRLESDDSYLLVALLMIPLADTYGFFGLLAAPPLAVSIAAFLDAMFDTRREQLALEAPGVQVEELVRRLDELRARADAHGDGVSPEIASLIARLEKLLSRASAALGNDDSATSVPTH